MFSDLMTKTNYDILPAGEDEDNGNGNGNDKHKHNGNDSDDDIHNGNDFDDDALRQQEPQEENDGTNELVTLGKDVDHGNDVDNGNDKDNDKTDALNDHLVITVDEAIERLGMGPFQIKVLVAAGLCFAADAMQVLLLSFLCEVLRVEWDLTDEKTASITSVLFLGAMLGTVIFGPLADRRGRKPVFLLAASVISFFGLAVGFVTGYWGLLAMIFMVGVGVGGLTVPFDILAEFLPSESRGKNLLLIEYFWTLGVLLVVALAYFTLGTEGTGGNWRLFVMLSSVPCCVSVVLGFIWVPESPRWLCTMDRCDQAMDIVRHAAQVNGLDVQFLFPEGMQLAPEEEEESSFSTLFSPKWRWTTLKLWGAWGAFAFGYYGTIMAITRIFDNDEDADGNELDSYNFDYAAIFVSSSAELVGTTFAISAVDVYGRIPLQVVSYAMAGIAVCTLCILAANEARRDILIAFGFLAHIFEMSGSCVSWVSTAEILTTEVRTTGHSAANAFARIGALVSPFVVEGNMPLIRMGFIMLAIHGVTVICISQLPETKGSHMGGGVSGPEHTETPSTGLSTEEPSEQDEHEQDTQADDDSTHSERRVV
jgi:MFS family permease